MTSARPAQLMDATKTQPAALRVTCLAHFVHDGIADALYILLPLWAQAFGLNYAQAGSLKMAYSAAMALFQIPAGMLAERFGERALLCVGTGLAGLAFAALALAPGYGALFALILVVGLGGAVQHPLSSSIIARAIIPEERRRALGIYNFSGDVGKMVVAFAVATAAGLLGWRASVAGYGALVVITGGALLVILARYGLGAAVLKPAQAVAAYTSLDWGFTNRRGYILLGVIQIIDSAARTGTLTLMPFLLIEKGASPASTGLALALVFAGGAAGKLACGLLAERVGVLRTVVLTEVATAAILIGVLPAGLTVSLALMPLLGMALNGTSSVLYGTVSDFVRPERQARAFGLFYTLGSVAGGLAPVIFGAVSDAAGLGFATLGLAGLALATLPAVGLLRPHVGGEK